jgi:hypothetical protein
MRIGVARDGSYGVVNGISQLALVQPARAPVEV